MRRVIWILVVVVIGLLVAITGVAAQERVIKMYLVEGPEAEGIRPVIERCASKIGIKADITTGPYHAMNETITLALTADKGAYDIVLTPGEWLVQWVTAGFLMPLDDFYPQVDPDFVPGLIDMYTVDGKLYALPYFSNPHIMFYRKDLFEEKGLRAPVTLEEFVEVATKLTVDIDGDGDIDVYGTALPGGPYVHTTYEFIENLYTFGGEVFNERGEPIFNSDEGLQALQFRLDLAYKHKVCPPWFIESRLETYMVEFAQGKIAMANGFPYNAGVLRDPETSIVGDKFDVAPIPGVANLSGWAFAVTSGSAAPMEAFELVKCITSFEGLKEATLANGVAAGRISVMKDSEVRDKWPWQVTYLAASENGRAYPPLMSPYWPEIESTLWTELNLALAKQKDPKVALDEAAKKARAILGFK